MEDKLADREDDDKTNHEDHSRRLGSNARVAVAGVVLQLGVRPSRHAD